MLCFMLHESYTSRCDTITIYMQQQRQGLMPLYSNTLMSQSCPWGWYQQMPIMFIQRASMLYNFPKMHGWSIKTVQARASGLNIPTLSWVWSWPWGWYLKMSIMFIQRASKLNNFPKIHDWGVKWASGLHFPTHFSAWGRPWGWYQKIPIMFFQRSHWTQYPKFMFRSFKTVETRASRLNFQTLPWIWSWPWGQYQKIPIMHFLRVCVFTKIPIVQLQNCGSQGPRNPFSNTFLSPRLALRVVTENTNNVFSKG